jgi:hypothetical protein
MLRMLWTEWTNIILDYSWLKLTYGTFFSSVF